MLSVIYVSSFSQTLQHHQGISNPYYECRSVVLITSTLPCILNGVEQPTLYARTIILPCDA